MGKKGKRKSSAAAELKEIWPEQLEVVDVARSRPQYQADPDVSKPELFQAQVLASRDPRLSPTLPNMSIYSRSYGQDSDEDIYLEEVMMKCEDGGSDDNDSFHSEDWVEKKNDAQDDKSKHGKIHVNPKFFPNLSANDSPEKRDESRTIRVQSKDEPASQSPRSRGGYGKRSGHGAMPEGAVSRDPGVEADNRIHKWVEISKEYIPGDGSKSGKSESPQRPIPTLISSGMERRAQPSDRMMDEPPPAAPYGGSSSDADTYGPGQRYPDYKPTPRDRCGENAAKAAIYEPYEPQFPEPSKSDRYQSSRSGQQSRYEPRTRESPRSSDRDYSRERDQYGSSRERENRRQSPGDSSRDRGRGRDRRDSSRDRYSSKYESPSPRREKEVPRERSGRSRIEDPQSPPREASRMESQELKPSRFQRPPDEPMMTQRGASPRGRRASLEPEPPRSVQEPAQRPRQRESRRERDPESSTSEMVLKPLSRFSRKHIEEHETDITRVDDLVADRHVDLINDLENVYQGRQAELEKEPFKHLPELSLNTQMESSFQDSNMVRRTQMENLRDWMSKKPLDAYMLGRLKLGNYRPSPIPANRKTDLIVQQSMREFHSEVHQILHGNTARSDGPNVFPSPSSPTEETVGQVFRQVKHYMDFLSEKPHLSRRSKPPETLQSSSGGNQRRQPSPDSYPRTKREPDKYDDYYDERHSGADINASNKRVMTIPLEPDSPERRRAKMEDQGMRTYRDDSGMEAPTRKSRWGEENKPSIKPVAPKEDAMYSPTRPTETDYVDGKTEVQYVLAVAKKKKKDKDKDEDDDKKKDKKKKKKKDKDKDKDEKKDKDKKDKKEKKKHKDKHKDKHDSSPEDRRRDYDRGQNYERPRSPDRGWDRGGRDRPSSPPRQRTRPSRFDRRPEPPEPTLSPPRGFYQNPYTLAWGLTQLFIDTNLDLLMQMREYCPNTENFVMKAETPENCFMWAIVLASHEKYISEHGEDLQMEQTGGDDTNEYGTSAGDGMNEYGSVGEKSGGGWVTVQEANDAAEKKDAAGGIPSKLTPQEAAKKPAPKSSRPLFKPPMAFMLNIKTTSLPAENDNYKPEDMDLGSDTEDAPREIAKAWKLLDSKIFDDAVRSAFEAFARDSSRLVRERFSMSSMTKLAREAQGLVMEAAQNLRHFSAICSQASGLYRHLRDEAEKLERDGTSPMDIHMTLKGRSPMKRGPDSTDLYQKKRAKMDERGSGTVNIAKEIRIPFEDKLSSVEASKLASFRKNTGTQKLSSEDLVKKAIEEKEAAERAAAEKARQEAMQNVDLKWSQPPPMRDNREKEPESALDSLTAKATNSGSTPRKSRWTSQANSLLSNVKKRQLAKKKEQEALAEQIKEQERKKEKEAEENAAKIKAKIIHMVGVKKKAEPSTDDDTAADDAAETTDDQASMETETPPVLDPTAEPPIPGGDLSAASAQPQDEELPPVPEPMEVEMEDVAPAPPTEEPEEPAEPAPPSGDGPEQPPPPLPTDPINPAGDGTTPPKKKKKKKKEKELESIPLPPGMGEDEEQEPKKVEITPEYQAEILRRAQEHMKKFLADKKPTVTTVTESQPGAVASVIQQAAQKAVAKQGWLPGAEGSAPWGPWGQTGDGTQPWAQTGDWSQWQQGQQWWQQGQQWGAQAGQWTGQWQPGQWGRPQYPSGAYYEEGPHLYPPGTLIRKAVFGEEVTEDQWGPPPASHVNFYIFNQDKPIIGSVKRFLKYMGAKEFDPHNVHLLKAMPNNEWVVFLHEWDMEAAHLVPNLMELKNDQKVFFATFDDVFDVKFHFWQPMFDQGGLVIPDETILLGMTPETLESMLSNLKKQSDEGMTWSVKIHLSALDEIRARRDVQDDPEETSRLNQLLEIIERYQTEIPADTPRERRLIEMLDPSLYPQKHLPPHEYLNSAIRLQYDSCHTLRHAIFLTDMPPELPCAKLFVERGLRVMDVCSFMKTLLDVDIGPPVPVPPPDYSKKLAPWYIDALVSNGVDIIDCAEIEWPEPDPVVLPAATEGEPQPPGTEGEQAQADPYAQTGWDQQQWQGHWDANGQWVPDYTQPQGAGDGTHPPGEELVPPGTEAPPGTEPGPPGVDPGPPGVDVPPPGVDVAPPGVDVAPPGVDVAPPGTQYPAHAGYPAAYPPGAGYPTAEYPPGTEYPPGAEAPPGTQPGPNDPLVTVAPPPAILPGWPTASPKEPEKTETTSARSGFVINLAPAVPDMNVPVDLPVFQQTVADKPVIRSSSEVVPGICDTDGGQASTALAAGTESVTTTQAPPQIETMSWTMSVNTTEQTQPTGQGEDEQSANMKDTYSKLATLLSPVDPNPPKFGEEGSEPPQPAPEPGVPGASDPAVSSAEYQTFSQQPESQAQHGQPMAAQPLPGSPAVQQAYVDPSQVQQPSESAGQPVQMGNYGYYAPPQQQAEPAAPGEEPTMYPPQPYAAQQDDEPPPPGM